jgi:uncharacterized protein with FMN-binding domain
MSIGKMIPPKWKPWLNSLIGGSVLLLSWFFLDQAERVQIAKLSRLSEPSSGGQAAADGISGVQPAPAPSPAPTPPPTVTPAEGIYRDGAYSATAQAPWGTMSIKVTVAGGKWTSFETPAIPDSPPSYRAVPLLVQQALQAQSADINGVSGATYTSDAFRDDLRQIVALSKK